MICNKKTIRCLIFTCICSLLQFYLHAQTDSLPKGSQTDTTNKQSFGEFVNSKKGIFGKVMKGLSKDTTDVQRANDLKSNDIQFKAFSGAVIRSITVNDLPFGIPLTDTSKKVVTSLTKLANTLHHTTRKKVIRNNLFFNVGDRVNPYLLADNETFLRRQAYIQDASILLVPVNEINLDSVDVFVTVKDLFSLGGSIASIGVKNTDIAIREDNISGSGNGFVIHGLYDMSRRLNFGAGLEFIQRNIASSFINISVGYQSYYPDISGLKEENYYFLRLTRELENRFMHWTYGLDASYHSTRNMYSTDSVYLSSVRYRYSNFDSWAGYNIDPNSQSGINGDSKLRKLIAMRFVTQEFDEIPKQYDSVYSWRYANLSGILGSVSFYRQNFYKSQYIYAFGINEDIPEGLNLTFTGGYVHKQNLLRPYLGFNFQQAKFTPKNNYFSYLVRAEGYLNNHELQDINLFGLINYFDHLKAMGARWKQRTFVSIGFAKQINTILNEPLYLDSKFALPEFRNGTTGGSLRASINAESVFYSPLSIAWFRFAPFIFSNAGLLTPYNTPVNSSNIYTIVGGGIRTRNESLIFGTIELKGYYFLKKNINNENWRIDVSTNISFKSNNQLIGKPNFIEVN